MLKPAKEIKVAEHVQDKLQKTAEAVITRSPTSTKKPDIILSLLNRAKGATIPQIQEAINWQPHSIRAVISGLRKKGINIARSQAKDGTALYKAEK